MTGIERYNSPAKVQRLGNDSLYGAGTDGSVVISANTSLTRDMYYDTLTINSNYHLNTNGYKVFVKNTLTINGSIGVSSGTSVSDGTIKGTSGIGANTSSSIGGNAAGSTYTASQAPSYVLYALENAINGGYSTTSGTFSFFSGGAGGENGVAGTVTPATAGSGATSGGPGGSGALNRNALVPGGPGTAGTPGTNGAAGSTPPAAAAGVGASGGAVVLICAKTIAGSGSIIAIGSNAVAGGNSATGTGATNGAAGNVGVAAPNQSLAYYTEAHAHYRTGDGTTGPHASIAANPLPVAHLVGTVGYHADGFWTYTHHGATPVHAANHHHGSSPHFGHASTNHYPVPSTSNFFHYNSIDHTAGGQFGHSGAVSHNFTHTSGSHLHNHYHEADHHHYTDAKNNHLCCTAAHRPRHDVAGTHQNGVARNTGNIRSVGHQSYAGGTAGTAGSAGTNGTNGSTTAGTPGKSGGGGGILIVSDAALPGGVTTNVSGGTLSGVSGNSGSVITVINA